MSERKVDPLDWFAPTAVTQTRDGTDIDKRDTPAFRKFLLAQPASREAECRASLFEAEFWDAGLSRAGMTLTPQLSHAETTCEEPVTVAYVRLKPWLTPAGKATVATVVAAIGSR